MSLIAGGARIVLTEYKNGAMHVECYGTRLTMVLAELNSGALGNDYHGGPAHVAALKQVIARATEVLAKIEIVNNQEEHCQP